jgi:D-tagatose-1,6-bisphosphate aldolase subunit GatZ/KbaZ
VKKFENMSFEAHSTDYQATDALSELVNQQFFFLKVGPELTFRLREAVFSLASIEEHLFSRQDQSGIIDAIDQAMNENSHHWTPYYQGDDEVVRQLKHFSYSDRIRYYWAVPTVKKALEKLFANLNSKKIPETIVSQYFSGREFDSLSVPVEQLVADHIGLCTARYYKACGYS